MITGFRRRLRAKARLQQTISDDEQERPRLVLLWTLSYLLRRLEVVSPVSREDGVGVSRLATIYTREGLVPQ